MTDHTTDSDVAFIRALAEMLRENDLTELEVERKSETEGRLSVRVSRAAPAVVQAVASPVPTASAVPAPAAASDPAPAEPVADPASHPGAVTSPMVGTVYLQAEPGAEPFAKIGDKVTEGQTLLIVEAMKTMNHIPAPHAGTVKRILVDDGAPVEYGALLMIVE